MRRRALRLALLGACLLWGLHQAVTRAWVSDDAFISFRYAKNLAQGEGLVFNRGERVEGYSNFLWTLLLAGALGAGLDPVPVSQALSIAAFLGTGLLLGLRRGDGEAPREVLPLAAFGFLVHREAQVWATGGLETAAFTLAATATLVLAARARTPRGALVAGGAGLATALLRPDGLLLLGLAGAVLSASALADALAGGPGAARREALRRAGRTAAAYWAPLLLVYVPYWLWRYRYYGDPFPNTYYAKSANLSYWEQGWRYLALFVETHPALALVPLALAAGLAAAVASPRVRRRLGAAGSRELVLAGAFVAAYGGYIVRLGGDFMFGRFLVPILPAALIAVEVAISALPAGLGARRLAPSAGGAQVPAPGTPARRGVLRPALAWVFAAACLVRTGTYDRPRQVHHGVAYEPDWYPPRAVEVAREAGRRLAPFVRDPEMVAGFAGTRAMLVYYAEVPVAIELETGLTDRVIARQPLARRRRPGHEKPAPPAYLVERGACVLLRPGAARRPVQRIAFDGVEATLFFYCRDFLEAVAAKGGVRFTRFPEHLDDYLARIGERSEAELADDLRFFRAFYFSGNPDPGREGRLAAELKARRRAADPAAPERLDSSPQPHSEPGGRP